MVRNYDRYKRCSSIIEHSVNNEKVNNLMVKNHEILWRKLVWQTTDQDVFNDTYMRLTFCFDDSEEFTCQFVRIFHMLKSAYLRDDTGISYVEIEDNLLSDTDSYTIDFDTEEVKQSKIKQDNLIDRLKRLADK